jgi:hypothetical protein
VMDTDLGCSDGFFTWGAVNFSLSVTFRSQKYLLTFTNNKTTYVLLSGYNAVFIIYSPYFDRHKTNFYICFHVSTSVVIMIRELLLIFSDINLLFVHACFCALWNIALNADLHSKLFIMQINVHICGNTLPWKILHIKCE